MSSQPGLIIVSAGYDAHADDPLANCELTTGDFGDLSASMRDLGAEVGSPVLVCLEGGYDTAALAASVVATVEALGDDAPAPEVPADLAADAIARLAGGRWGAALSR